MLEIQLSLPMHVTQLLDTCVPMRYKTNKVKTRYTSEPHDKLYVTLWLHAAAGNNTATIARHYGKSVAYPMMSKQRLNLTKSDTMKPATVC